MSLRLPTIKSSSDGNLVGALDLGTNNCRLLIAETTESNYRVVDGFSKIVRFGEGLSERGLLSDAAINRTVAALKICSEKIERRGVSNVRCVATEAARQAKNRYFFLKRVKAETNLVIEIISSREEAELTLAACSSLLDRTKKFALLFDIGGGSGEFVWVKLDRNHEAKIVGWISLPCGLMTLTEQHGNGDFSPKDYDNLVLKLIEMLEPFNSKFKISEYVEQGRVQLLGTAGTVTTIAGVNLNLPRYVRERVDGSSLAFTDALRICRDLSTKKYTERASYPCIGSDRAELIVAGCAVLEAVCRVWPVGRLRIADRGVREGILAKMVKRFGEQKPNANNLRASRTSFEN